MDHAEHSSLLAKLEKGSGPLFYVAVVPINALGQVLVGKRREDGIWTTPAGGAERGETPVQAAVRECWEEAGLIVFGDRLELVSVKETPNGKPIHCYLYRTHQTGTSSKTDPDKEVEEWNWYSKENLPDGLSRQKNQNRLETINQAMMKYYGIMKADKIPGGLADKKKVSDFDKKALKQGVKVELEHTDDANVAREIAMDHLTEDPKYYEKLARIEKAGSTGEGSRGGKVIGHTKSGKPVYESSEVHSYAAHSFSSDDHHQAAQHHYSAAQAAKNPKEAAHHVRKWQAHRDASERMKTRLGNKAHYVKKSEELDTEFLTFLLKSEAEIREHADGSTWKKQEDGSWKRSKGAPKEQKEQYEKDRERMIRQVIKFKGKMAEGPNYRAFLDSLNPDRLKEFHAACVECSTAPKEPEMEKSTTAMMHNDGLDINTADFAVESKTADPKILEELHQLMEGFEFGDLPREYQLPKGMLYLTKVDDGVYSGYFKKQELAQNEQNGLELMEDNAKVRIERQTLPTLCQFLAAKEWLPRPEVAQKPTDNPPMNNEQIQVLEQKLMEPMPEIQPMMLPPVPEGSQESDLDKRIRLLELVNKLIS